MHRRTLLYYLYTRAWICNCALNLYRVSGWIMGTVGWLKNACLDE